MRDFEDTSICGGAFLAKNMSADIWVSEHPRWVHLLQNLHEIVKPRVQAAEILRTEPMSLCPVWLSSISNDNVLITLKQLAVRDIEFVRPEKA